MRARPIVSERFENLDAYRTATDEAAVERLRAVHGFSPEQRARIATRARDLVAHIRARRRVAGGIDLLLQEYDLSTGEGVALMCLAEALLRVPDAETASRLIRDKILDADWSRHIGKSDHLLVNASTWAMMLTGKVLEWDPDSEDSHNLIAGLLSRSAEPVIRRAMVHAMHIIGDQFVLGQTIDAAIESAGGPEHADYLFSFDMLGEGARTAIDAERYLAAYRDAVTAIGGTVAGNHIHAAPGVSIKLSALHPRYEYAQRDRVLAELVPRVGDLARAAKERGVSLCIDAEESERLLISLEVFEAVKLGPDLRDWPGLGLAVQAYQKRAPDVIAAIEGIARDAGSPVMVRLVKGAYWDSEIKRAQQEGLADYPVYTRKQATDVSYLACARALLDLPEHIHPQFATHNAHTIAAVLEIAGPDRRLEFQRLHGMGKPLYDKVLEDGKGRLTCRTYAPVGGHRELLSYLVRRLLENGANSSFVNRLADDALPVERVIADPDQRLKSFDTLRNGQIPLPEDLYRPHRANSPGCDLTMPAVAGAIAEALHGLEPVHAGHGYPESTIVTVRNPARRSEEVGTIGTATSSAVDGALRAAAGARDGWNGTPAAARAEILERAAELLDARMFDFAALCIREAGKTIPDAIDEVREAADFLRYYAAEARAAFGKPQTLPGPTGETNALRLAGRGTIACISPWNFPLAIFVGQVSAALAAGNCVAAKSAEQTPLIAEKAVRMLHEAGVPEDVLHHLPGDGPSVGGVLVSHPLIDGVAFTGSFETARAVNQALAAREGPLVPLVAETGGINAMIADSTALPEQLTDDVAQSVFRSAGQRCSALRALLLQDDTADGVIDMLAGKAAELRLGDPAMLETDVGPIIDEEALARLETHCRQMDEHAVTRFAGELPEGTADGTFLAPRIYELGSLDDLENEVFGPVLHVIRYDAADIDRVIDQINRKGHGLTLGIHSRIGAFADYVSSRVRVGNAYVNRNMIGAVVGVQPFGGEGLSGTGPKAGGPHYLQRFAVERALTVNTAATGGNAELLAR